MLFSLLMFVFSAEFADHDPISNRSNVGISNSRVSDFGQSAEARKSMESFDRSKSWFSQVDPTNEEMYEHGGNGHGPGFYKSIFIARQVFTCLKLYAGYWIGTTIYAYMTSESSQTGS